MRVAAIVAVALLLLSGPVARADEARDKRVATALLKQGVEKFQQGAYAEALELFRSAYQTYDSPKILLNIGTTLNALKRHVEAAEAYEKYLAAPGMPEARRAEVKKLLDEIDARHVGKFRIEVVGATGTLQIDDRDLGSYDGVVTIRVRPGQRVVRLVREGAPPIEERTFAIPGEVATVTLKGAPSAPPPAPKPQPKQDDPGAPTTVASGSAPPPPGDDEGYLADVTRQRQPEPQFSRLTGVLFGDFDYKLRGVAVYAGVGYRIAANLDLEGAALLGAEARGAFLGGRYQFLEVSKIRLSGGAGFPVFFSDGARVAFRGTAGASISPFPRLEVGIELGFERYFNPEDGFAATIFLPAVGVRARI